MRHAPSSWIVIAHEDRNLTLRLGEQRNFPYWNFDVARAPLVGFRPANINAFVYLDRNLVVSTNAFYSHTIDYMFIAKKRRIETQSK